MMVTNMNHHRITTKERTGQVQLWARVAALRLQRWPSDWSWGDPDQQSLDLFLKSDLRVGARGGLGGGEGVLVKGREGKEGKAGKEKLNGFEFVSGLKVVNGGW